MSEIVFLADVSYNTMQTYSHHLNYFLLLQDSQYLMLNLRNVICYGSIIFISMIFGRIRPERLFGNL